jgi:hypothetical protein
MCIIKAIEVPKSYRVVLQCVMKNKVKKGILKVSDNEHLEGCECGNNGGRKFGFLSAICFDFGVGKFRSTVKMHDAVVL